LTIACGLTENGGMPLRAVRACFWATLAGVFGAPALLWAADGPAVAGSSALLPAVGGLGVVGVLGWRLVVTLRERRRLEAQLEKARQETERIRVRVAEQREHFQASLADLAHALRTPLNGVVGFAQLLAKDASLTPRARERVAVIQTSGDALRRAIDDGLEAARGPATDRERGRGRQSPVRDGMAGSSAATAVRVEDLQELLELAQRGEIRALRARLGVLQDRHACDPRLLELSQLARDYQMERIRVQLGTFLAHRSAA
jgi:signal transduction histidine kinase